MIRSEKGIYFRGYGIEEQSLGHLFITLSNTDSFNKTDLEQFLFQIPEELAKGVTEANPSVMSTGRFDLRQSRFQGN